MSSRAEPKPIGDLSICVAIDKSGSTWGGTLDEEIRTVEKICSLRSPRNENPVRLLPWCDEALPPICLPKESRMMRSLDSDGGTDPKVLYTSEANLHALSCCGMWFLLTDGDIQTPLVQNFALTTRELGLHGLACIIVIFGSTSSGPPANCDISVGLAIFAVVPDCLFLFQDISTGSVSILQAKGCFRDLLPKSGSSYIPLVLDEHTTWAELPHISYEDLSRIRISAPKKLEKDEIALQKDLTVRIEDLYSGSVDKESVGQILMNEDNLKSLVLAEMTRGTGKELQNWLAEQQRTEPELTRYRADVDGLAQRTVAELLECLLTGEPGGRIEGLREKLRKAHTVNRRHFQHASREHMEEKTEIQYHNACLHSARERLGTAVRGLRDQSTQPKEEQRRPWVAHHISDPGPVLGYEMHTYSPLPQVSRDVDADEPNLLFLPGFQRSSSNPGNEFVGRCMFCHHTSVLAILLKTPPQISTPNFPRKGSLSPLAFPLAMSSFAETDVVSFFLSCDSCALYLVRNFKSPLSETITAALPLTSLERNQDAWLDCLGTTFKARFRKCDLSALFVAILDKKIIDNQAREASPEDIKLYEEALQWTKRSLLAVTTVPVTLSSSFRHGRPANPRTDSLLTVLSDRALLNPIDTDNVEIAMLRYPLPGFMVLIRLMIDQGNTQGQIYAFIFQRLVYHLTEVYLTLASSGKEETLHKTDIMLSRSPRHSKAISEGDSDNEPKPSISIEELLALNLLDQNTLATFRTAKEFEDVEKRTGPATAVYLHHLSRHGGSYDSPVDCFNALKVRPSVRKVILTPLAISEGLSKDLISQLTD